jgi:hypothetical protein
LLFKVEKQEARTSESIYDFPDSEEDFNPLKPKKEETVEHVEEESTRIKLRVSGGQIVR